MQMTTRRLDASVVHERKFQHKLAIMHSSKLSLVAAVSSAFYIICNK